MAVVRFFLELQSEVWGCVGIENRKYTCGFALLDSWYKAEVNS